MTQTNLVLATDSIAICTINKKIMKTYKILHGLTELTFTYKPRAHTYNYKMKQLCYGHQP